jgi:hypothetical protein
MACQIQINSISGTSPFDVYFCDLGFYQCEFIETLTSPSFPVLISLPYSFVGTTNILVRIIDGNGCEYFNTYVQPTPTPTASITPTLTPTPTPTPSGP